MNNTAAIHDLNRAMAEFRERQNVAPTPHSAREIAQLSMLAEYLHETHTTPAMADTTARPPLLLTSRAA
jgi:hypothetical protein